MNVYRDCPTFVSTRFNLRLVSLEDAPFLLRVYSDPAAHLFFNSDNCHSDFRYSTLKEMEDCIRMWLWSYEHGHFVRWTILRLDVPVGTVEMFRRSAGSDGQGEGVLRIDLLSKFEQSDVIDEILRTILPEMHELFHCAHILTKALPLMSKRRLALVLHGFFPNKAPLIGENGVEYGHYWGCRYAPRIQRINSF